MAGLLLRRGVVRGYACAMTWPTSTLSTVTAMAGPAAIWPNYCAYPLVR
jgi:hypothetical protein